MRRYLGRQISPGKPLAAPAFEESIECFDVVGADLTAATNYRCPGVQPLRCEQRILLRVQIPSGFQYVDDLLEGMIRMMNVSDPSFFGPVNIGNPHTTKIQFLIFASFGQHNALFLNLF